MRDEKLSEAIYNKYIAPTNKPRAGAIGVEIEMPVVALDGTAVEE